MYLTGFADEAAGALPDQIRATQELGWSNIESRKIEGINIHSLDDRDFDRVVETLAGSGVTVNCFGSEIANWQRQVTDPFEETLELVERTIPRMLRLGTKMVRIMSYAVLNDSEGKVPEDQKLEERCRRLREIVTRFTDAGLTPVHENCMNYGGMSWRHSLELVERVPGLKLVFDTGNPVSTDDFAQAPPRPKQSSWEFYHKVKAHIAYIHIKDKKRIPETGKMVHTFPGEGVGDVRKIVKDLLDGGYNGGISMEPHLSAVVPDGEVASVEEIKYRNYVEYGRRFMKLLEDIGHPWLEIK
ncbi:MAG: sugar phosphate isomerase/epimerase [Verrucomicrobia bacterium]|nr:sugar phosphate isomerase/epimerase [Verrucomicrobiota bacterium]MCH8512579.1 sugar phosphate isomerase/epimerase [Kiritimatiellia bacterium]